MRILRTIGGFRVKCSKCKRFSGIFKTAAQALMHVKKTGCQWCHFTESKFKDEGLVNKLDRVIDLMGGDDSL